MNGDLIFLPVLLQVLLVIILYVALARVKYRESAQGKVNEERRGLYDDAWPESVLKINNCIRNQSEAPVLFYILALVIWSIDAVNLLTLVLAWAFVVSRYIHAYIHTGTNYVPYRRKVFMLGCLLLLFLTLYAVVKLLVSGAG